MFFKLPVVVCHGVGVPSTGGFAGRMTPGGRSPDLCLRREAPTHFERLEGRLVGERGAAIELLVETPSRSSRDSG